MVNTFRIYIKPADLLQLHVTDDLTLDFSAPWMRSYNAILVDKYPRDGKFEVWPTTVDVESKKRICGSPGFIEIPEHLHQRLTEALKESGFAEFVPQAGTP